mgnify:CR=1 FL=1|tara:strand:+ start:196 stop:342 length:147 start_codon:yes stop_codon:yes gene_type:complete
MRIQLLLEEAKNKLANGYSESALVQFVYMNANNDAQAKVVLQNVLNCE